MVFFVAFNDVEYSQRHNEQIDQKRGNRSDDKRSDSAMEDRKRQGYF